MNNNDTILSYLFSSGLLPPPVSTLQEAVYQAGFRYRDHVYDDEVEIVYVQHGASYVGINQKEFIRVRKNDCLVIFPQVRHNFFLKENENCRIIDLVFKPGNLPGVDLDTTRQSLRFLSEVQAPRIAYLRILDNGEFRGVLERILSCAKTPGWMTDPLSKLFFCELYILLSKNLGLTHDDSGRPRNRHVTIGLEYMNNHFTSRVTTEAVARHAGVSERHFSRLFIQEMGMSVQDYVGILRIRKAKDLLENSDLDITGIAYNLGFSTSQYFTTCFKRIEHLTPKEYRRLARVNSGFGPLEPPAT